MELNSTVVEFEDMHHLDDNLSLCHHERAITFMEAYSLVNKYRDKRILVADDEEFCIATMKILLKKAGVDIDYQVDYCLSGQEALDAVIESYSLGLSYKLILTDFRMPFMDGIQATEKILSHLESI